MDLDLNLLVALDALLQEGSVGGAADRLGLSQPAMSRTLGRIRQVTGDQILVRSGRSMVPTPYADAVRGQVRVLIEQAQGLLNPTHGVEPATLDRTFTLRCHDAVIDAAGPAIVAAVRDEAPGVRLRFLGETATDTDDLRAGRVDLEIAGEIEPPQPDLRSQIIGRGMPIVALRADHPIGTLTLKEYAAAEHVTVSRRGHLRDRLDDLLQARGFTRRVVASVPTTAAALRLVAASDLLVAVPTALADDALAGWGLRTLPMPLELEPVTLAMSWHRRYDDDGAHTWLRVCVRDALTKAGFPGQPPER